MRCVENLDTKSRYMDSRAVALPAGVIHPRPFDPSRTLVMAVTCLATCVSLFWLFSRAVSEEAAGVSCIFVAILAALVLSKKDARRSAWVSIQLTRCEPLLAYKHAAGCGMDFTFDQGTMSVVDARWNRRQRKKLLPGMKHLPLFVWDDDYVSEWRGADDGVLLTCLTYDEALGASQLVLRDTPFDVEMLLEKRPGQPVRLMAVNSHSSHGVLRCARVAHPLEAIDGSYPLN